MKNNNQNYIAHNDNNNDRKIMIIINLNHWEQVRRKGIEHIE